MYGETEQVITVSSMHLLVRYTHTQNICQRYCGLIFKYNTTVQHMSEYAKHCQLNIPVFPNASGNITAAFIQMFFFSSFQKILMSTKSGFLSGKWFTLCNHACSSFILQHLQTSIIIILRGNK